MQILETRRTFRAVYDNGELFLAEPVDITGTWHVEVTFLEREDPDAVPLESSPHRPELPPVPDRIEEFHRAALGEFHRMADEQKAATAPHL